MKNALRSILILCGVLIALSIIANSRGADKIPWRKTLEQAQAESDATHKPVLIYFTASWCGPCQEMKRETWSDPRIETALQNLIPVKIDVDEARAVAERFNVTGIPRVQLLGTGGSAGPSHTGFMSADELLRWLQANQGPSTMGG
jgi:thiol:disulfide interchange protein